jgi:tetratricopeptide (TPR) repeat protein
MSCSTGPEAWRKKADKAYADQHYAEAARAYAEVLKKDPAQSEARFFLAVCQQVQGQYQEAIANLDQVLVEVPDAYKAALNRGHCHYALEEYASAQADYELVLALEPGYGLALNPLAHMQFYLGDTSAACQTLAQAVDAMAGREVDPALQKACEAR